MEIKKMSMDEVIAHHNELAEKLGVPTAESFKSLGAARMATLELQTKVNTLMNTETTEAPFDTDAPADAPAEATSETSAASKYNTAGRRGPNQGIGAYAIERLKGENPPTTQELLAEIQMKFPGAKTSAAGIAYYKNVIKYGPVNKRGPGRTPEQLREAAAKLNAEARKLEIQAQELEAVAAAEAAAQAQAAA